LTPYQNEVIENQFVHFSWNLKSNQAYNSIILQISNDDNFSNLISSDTLFNLLEIDKQLLPNKQYYTRVGIVNSNIIWSKKIIFYTLNKSTLNNLSANYSADSVIKNQGKVSAIIDQSAHQNNLIQNNLINQALI